MRKGLVGIAAAIAVAALPATAGASHSGGPGPKFDKLDATGYFPLNTGPLGVLDAQGHVNARSTTVDADGHWWLRIFDTPFGDFEVRGRITCLTSNGNVGVWGGEITESNTASLPVGAGIIGRDVDNGEGRNDPPDTHSGFLVPQAPPEGQCPPVPALPAQPTTQGNVVVHDGI